MGDEGPHRRPQRRLVQYYTNAMGVKRGSNYHEKRPYGVACFPPNQTIAWQKYFYALLRAGTEPPRIVYVYIQNDGLQISAAVYAFQYLEKEVGLNYWREVSFLTLSCITDIKSYCC